MTFENRLPANYAFGSLTSAAAISDTTLTSTDFATRLASGLSTTNYVPLTLQDPSTGNYEICWVSAHTAAATTCTVVRGKEGSSARAWGSGTLWTIAPTLRDGVLWVTTRANLPADPHVGLRCFIQDEQTIIERNLACWGPPVAFLRQTVAQTGIAQGVFTSVTFNAEDHDNANGHDTATNNSRYTCKLAGKYEFAGGGCFASGAGFRATRWAKNGVSVAGSQLDHTAVTGGEWPIPARTIQLTLAVNDYVEIQIFHDVGAGLSTGVSNDTQSSMSVKYLGSQ